MNNFIASNRTDIHTSENVLGIANEARLAKKNNPLVINATTGSYYDEDGSLHLFNSVKEAFKNVSFNDELSYAPVPGPTSYNDSIVPWILGDDNLKHYSSYHISSVATMGGSGAISMALTNYADIGSTVLLPSYAWPAYKQIIINANLKPVTYDLFDDNYNFNAASIKEKLLSIKEQTHTVIIINDPCHNPTGYSMSNNDYCNLVKELNSIDIPNYVTILMDVAYLDFEPSFGALTRLNFLELQNLNDHYHFMFAASLSKTLGIYGLRLGALIDCAKSEEEANDFIEKAKFFARSTWSNPNHFACDIVANNLNTIEKRNSFKEEIKAVAYNLIKRGVALTSILKDANIPFISYKGGFFVYLVNPVEDLINKLIKENIYAIQMGDGVRFAISSISFEEAIRLGETLVKIYNN